MCSSLVSLCSHVVCVKTDRVWWFGKLFALGWYYRIESVWNTANSRHFDDFLANNQRLRGPFKHVVQTLLREGQIDAEPHPLTPMTLTGGSWWGSSLEPQWGSWLQTSSVTRSLTFPSRYHMYRVTKQLSCWALIVCVVLHLKGGEEIKCCNKWHTYFKALHLSLALEQSIPAKTSSSAVMKTKQTCRREPQLTPAVKWRHSGAKTLPTHGWVPWFRYCRN